VTDFEIKIKIAIYSPNGQFIKEANNTSLADKTIHLIMEDLSRGMKNRKEKTEAQLDHEKKIFGEVNDES